MAAVGWDVGVPPLGGVMRAAGLKDIEAYVSRQNNKVIQYIASLPIMDIGL